ncbi:acyl-CoA:lysophosphatidylglycerol acyltransferase 1-like isoform X2 [Bradysia coprophila]|uniref:acyl-CoA:lysophosphatidylglycerol acyltransferase 1-like isoform X2 n=1 Tax=Bradysia coprophila TaxID=38358 RepID=UPI00187DD6D6|nr:acyl-CoA:lysophosphatidylglycerol acyltransferase 1-like isoform X2 [Bradysia coprophila]XP_037038436.1 acyl-CoA:lysophosphatidylglycerol acyltransferase 1-like isoform X2 [Bradysia coprophila]
MSDLFRNNFITYPKALFRTTIVIINNIYCIPTYVLWMTLLLPVKSYKPDLYYRIEGLFFHWLLSVVAMWSWTAGYDIVELGDDIAPTRKKDVRTMVIANHQSTADVPLMMASFTTKPDILPNIMWIMERLFKFTNFGIVSLIHQDFFISSGKNVRDLSIKKLMEHIEESFIPRMRNWMVLFPEGGFLRKRKEVSQQYALKNNLPLMNHVSLPRVGALKAIFSVLPPHETQTTSQQGNNNSCKQSTNNGTVTQDNGEDPAATPTATETRHYLDYILDITIAYPNGKPLDILNIIHGIRLPCPTYFLYRLYHTSQLPKTEDGLTKWLYERWHEKEKILDDFYKNGNFSIPVAMPPIVVQQDMLRLVIINLFFITSTYVHLQMFYMLADYCNRFYVLGFA